MLITIKELVLKVWFWEGIKFNHSFEEFGELLKIINRLQINPSHSIKTNKIILIIDNSEPNEEIIFQCVNMSG